MTEEQKAQQIRNLKAEVYATLVREGFVQNAKGWIRKNPPRGRDEMARVSWNFEGTKAWADVVYDQTPEEITASILNRTARVETRYEVTAEQIASR